MVLEVAQLTGSKSKLIYFERNNVMKDSKTLIIPKLFKRPLRLTGIQKNWFGVILLGVVGTSGIIFNIHDMASYFLIFSSLTISFFYIFSMGGIVTDYYFGFSRGEPRVYIYGRIISHRKRPFIKINNKKFEEITELDVNEIKITPLPNRIMTFEGIAAGGKIYFQEDKATIEWLKKYYWPTQSKEIKKRFWEKE